MRAVGTGVRRGRVGDSSSVVRRLMDVRELHCGRGEGGVDGSAMDGWNRPK